MNAAVLGGKRPAPPCCCQLRLQIDVAPVPNALMDKVFECCRRSALHVEATVISGEAIALEPVSVTWAFR